MIAYLLGDCCKGCLVGDCCNGRLVGDCLVEGCLTGEEISLAYLAYFSLFISLFFIPYC